MQVILLGTNINGLTHFDKVMEHSENSIRRAFVFRNKFYNKASKILFSARQLFTERNGCHYKKTTCKNTTNPCNADKYEKVVHFKVNDTLLNIDISKTVEGMRTKQAGDTIFIGVHVRCVRHALRGDLFLRNHIFLKFLYN